MNQIKFAGSESISAQPLRTPGRAECTPSASALFRLTLHSFTNRASTETCGGGLWRHGKFAMPTESHTMFKQSLIAAVIAVSAVGAFAQAAAPADAAPAATAPAKKAGMAKKKHVVAKKKHMKAKKAAAPAA
jgi:hypothetical protein